MKVMIILKIMIIWIEITQKVRKISKENKVEIATQDPDDTSEDKIAVPMAFHSADK